MNILALLLILVAVVIFIATHFGVARRWANVALGLAFFAAAIAVQFIWQARQWHIKGGS